MVYKSLIFESLQILNNRLQIFIQNQIFMNINK